MDPNAEEFPNLSQFLANALDAIHSGLVPEWFLDAVAREAQQGSPDLTPAMAASLCWGWVAGRLYTEYMHTQPEYIVITRSN